MRRALSTVQPSLLDFSNFAGGLNLRTAPENINDNELSTCVNMTYSSSPGKLRTRSGIGAALAEFSTRIMGLYFFKNKLLAVTKTDHKLWDVALTLMGTTSEIGVLTSSARPVWCEYGGKLYIASGGTLQEYDGNSLITIAGAPNADIVYARAGRLYCTSRNTDSIRGCAVGDPANWTIPVSPTDADPVEVQIGYKVAGNITACVPGISDVIVFKERGIFRLIGEYPDWTIKEVSRDESVPNHHCAIAISGYVYYLDLYKGLRLLQGTSGYEEIAPAEGLPNVNPWIRAHIDHDFSGLWHLPARNIMLVIPNDDTGEECLPCYYEFGVQSMPALLWRFPGAVQAIVEPDRDHLYIAIGNGVYDFSGVSAYDPDLDDGGTLRLVQCGFSTKVYRGFSHYVVKRITIRAESLEKQVLTTVPCQVLVNDVPYMGLLFNEDSSPMIYGNNSQVYLNDGDLILTFFDYVDFSKHNLCRQKSIQFHFSNGGAPFELTRFAAEVVSVGVTA